jgi:ATP-dependent Clp protease ATP-binding subunit ClpX
VRYEPPTYDRIPSVDAMVAQMDRTVSGLELVKRRLALALRRFMVAGARDHDRPPQNVLIIGPSGGGKTFILRELLSAIPVIWAEVDATSFSDVGYVGRDVTSGYLGLFGSKWRGTREDQEPPHTQREIVAMAERWGVLVIDEFDKLRAAARPKEGERQVGRALQTELLKLAEGVDAQVKRNDEDRGVMFGTHNVLHIAVGAFQGMNEIVGKDMLREGIAPPPDAYMKANIFNVIEYGFLEELVGRFSTIVTLPTLDAGHMSRILREHVIPDFERQCADDGIVLSVDEGAMMALSSRATGLPIGARALAPMVDDCLAVNWGLAQRGDQLRLTAQSVKADMSLLVRPVAA